MKITIEPSNDKEFPKVTVELENDHEVLPEVISKIIKPALVLWGFHPSDVDEYISEP